MAEEMWALGLMSGTSLDGIDAALIRTDGSKVLERGAWITRPLDDDLRARLQGAMRGEGDIAKIENDVTMAHVEVVKELLVEAEMSKRDIDVIGFHGLTIAHRPSEDITWQLGNGSLMAEKTGIDTVCDFRRRDVAAGGEGAPLVPLYHAALAKDLDLPVAVLNIGGVANVTWIGRSEVAAERLLAHDIIAFDTGPGNGLIDEWVQQKLNVPFDKDGKIAMRGTVHLSVVEEYMKHPYFEKHPPKSLDRYDFDLTLVENLSAEDGAATLAEFTAESVSRAELDFPAPARVWLVCGGGRHNPVVMDALRKKLTNVEPVECVGWEGDALEAQAFAFLAVRSLNRQPLSLPTTTGTNHAVTGGVFCPA